MSETKELTYDKAKWGIGPWQDEPDRVEFEHAGLPCLIVRGPQGSFCGYVAVSEGHPYFEQSYDSADVDVHGGLTYADHCHGHICHVPKPGEPDNVWWLGFDCAHSGDYSPKYGGEYWGKGYPWPDHKYDHAAQLVAHETDWCAEVYRDEAYVRREVEKLAQQLADRKGA